MKFLDKIGLTTFINLIKSKKLFGSKIKLDNSVEARRKYLLEIDYDAELKIDWEPVTINGFELPTQTQSNLRITSLYSAVQKGNILEVE